MQRRLAAILFADVAGYTRLMDEHETNTHRRLMGLLEEVIEPAISEGGGQILKIPAMGFSPGSIVSATPSTAPSPFSAESWRLIGQ